MLTATALLHHLDHASPWPAELRGLADVDAAYQLALGARAQRISRGERPRGYKIGFTNRTIWERYRVYAPIWGTVWDTTLVEAGVAVPLAGLCQPRLEPEIVFGISAMPLETADLETLLACIAWCAPGFEIVQAHAPDWKFSAAETVADGGLHGRLLVGKPVPTTALGATAQAFNARLAASRVRLHCGGEPVAEGVGAHVLDGPLHALLHFVKALASCPGAPRLQPGDVVTTGTWTDAWPLAPGQHWRAEFDAPVGAVEIRLV